MLAIIATRVAACTGRLGTSFIEAWISGTNNKSKQSLYILLSHGSIEYIYQERTIIYIYIYNYSNELCNRKMHGVCLLLFWVLNVKYNDVKYRIVYFRENNNWCVTFVNLLENQQTPLYLTLYSGYCYRLRNQFTLKELKTIYIYILKSSIQQKQFRFDTGCWTQCLWARRWVELTGKNVRILTFKKFALQSMHSICII